MAKYRINRVNEEVTKEMAQILSEIKDPRVSGVMITVTGVDVTADLKYAKIYFSYLGECDEKELMKGLKSASPYMRRELASRINLRITPELSFIKDRGLEHGAEISALLNKIGPIPEKEEDDNEL